jgi:putative tryptophan/tyrosine transport system substrate-binding protein
MKRREFIAGLCGVATARMTIWPVVARAQQPTFPTIGYIYAGPPNAIPEAAFRKGLSEMGFVESRNVAIVYRYAENQYDRLPALAAELVRQRVTVIFTAGGAVLVPAAKAATTTIPIVFTTGANPVETGMVASFNRPGGNVTGISSMSTELTAKRLGLLHALLPAAARFAVLVNPDVPRTAASVTAHAQATASTIGRQIEVFAASTNGEIDAAFAGMVQKRSDALLIGTNVFFTNRRVQLATLAARHALPTINFTREFVEAGGLMSYGASNADMNRQGGIYVGRILKGEKPADLPVMQPTRFELVINLQTARALGIEVPPTLLAAADEVIE